MVAQLLLGVLFLQANYLSQLLKAKITQRITQY